MVSAAAIWHPAPGQVIESNLARFADLSHTKFRGPTRSGNSLADWSALWSWSVEQRGDFWAALAEFSGTVANWGSAGALVEQDGMLQAKWFPGCRINYAENLLLRKDDHIAIVATDERGRRRQLSYRELNALVVKFASGLVAEGIRAGDVIAGVLPNIPEAIVAMLGTASIGAVWTACSPDYGVEALLDRLGQVRPRLLVTADGYTYAGKQQHRLLTVEQLARGIDSIHRVVVVPFLDLRVEVESIPNAVAWEDFLVDGNAGFVRLPFESPLFILYSSGTTGQPKCIVHGAGGTLLQHRKEHLLHVDLRPKDRMFFYTTCSWMMWNWLVSGLATGATIILYDGSPTYPGPGVLWELAEREGITVFGTSPKYLAALQKDGYVPRSRHALASLRTVLSTGSPLAPEQHNYVHDAIGPEIHLASMSGGTDIISCFCLGNPWLPVHPGEVQGPGLGMAVEVWDHAGAPVLNQRGELVCSRAFPSMPLGFWNDHDGARFRAAYFERYPGVWHHGDFAVQTSRGGFAILGRSDSVLNPGGVRIGTAEIYRQVAHIAEIEECVAVGQIWEDDVRIVLFVRVQPGRSLDGELLRRIKDTIRQNTTPRHVPARILQVPDIPTTRTGKISESAVRNAVHGEPIENLSAIGNPESLEHFKNRPELAS